MKFCDCDGAACESPGSGPDAQCRSEYALNVIALGVAFYDAQRGHGSSDLFARHQAVAYMRRKADDAGDAMPFYEALADALARRAAARIAGADALAQLAPQGGRQ